MWLLYIITKRNEFLEIFDLKKECDKIYLWGDMKMEKLFIVGLGIAVLFILFFIISIIRGMSSKGIEKNINKNGNNCSKSSKKYFNE